VKQHLSVSKRQKKSFPFLVLGVKSRNAGKKRKHGVWGEGICRVKKNKNAKGGVGAKLLKAMEGARGKRRHLEEHGKNE